MSDFGCADLRSNLHTESALFTQINAGKVPVVGAVEIHQMNFKNQIQKLPDKRLRLSANIEKILLLTGFDFCILAIKCKHYLIIFLLLEKRPFPRGPLWTAWLIIINSFWRKGRHIPHVRYGGTYLRPAIWLLDIRFDTESLRPAPLWRCCRKS